MQYRRALTRDQSVGSPTALLIILVDTSIATISGNAKAMTFRKPAGPSDIDSAIIGRMKDARIPTNHTAAFVAMSFCLSAFVIVQAFRGRAGVTS